jgi:hypothetical protein
MNRQQIKVMGKAIMWALPLLVLHGYLLAIIYQQWWLKQFGLPSDFVYFTSNTLVMAAIISGIMLSILVMCYYTLSPLLNSKNPFRLPGDSANLDHARMVTLTLAVYGCYGVVSFFNFQGSIQLLSWAIVALVGAFILGLVNIIVSWGIRSRKDKRTWYTKSYLYFERRLMTPIIVSTVLFLVGSYFVAGQLSIMNWQAYVKDPTYVLVDEKDEYILIGLFGDKAGVVQKGEFGIEDNTTKFIDLERIRMQSKPY